MTVGATCSERFACGITGAGTVAEAVERLEHAFAQGDLDLTGELLERDFPVIWFGMSPMRTGEIVDALVRAGAPEHGLARSLQQLLWSGEGVRVETLIARAEAEQIRIGPGRFPLAVLLRMAQGFKLRTAGQVRSALEIMSAIEGEWGTTQLRVDGHTGWRQFITVQHGVSAMMAGEFQTALMSFERARMRTTEHTLSFFARDACVKAAVIEALYGDVARARVLLDEAASYPSTGSWADDDYAGAYALAASRAHTATATEALRATEAIQPNQLGELWPFYAVALTWAMVVADDLKGAASRLADFEQLSPTGGAGDGFVGSALLLAGAQNAMASGDLSEAEVRLGRADRSIAPTRVLHASYLLASGRPRQALRLAEELRDETRRLRLLELRRLAVIAGAHIKSGQVDECVEVIDYVLNAVSGLTTTEVRYFPTAVQKLAVERFPEWPREEGGSSSVFGLHPIQREALTERELQALRGLAAGLSREQIASAAFISLNTVKVHLRSLYRKLGAGSRTAAVLEGERRGLI